MAVTWNPADKASSITLSAGNLAAAKDAVASWGGVRATSVIPSNTKRFWSHTLGSFGAGSGQGVGLANASATLGNYLGSDNHGIGYFPATGQVLRNGGVLATIMSGMVGDIIDVAFDNINHKIWFRKNGGYWNNSTAADPSVNSGGIDISLLSGPCLPAISIHQGAAITANFGGAEFIFPPPIGFIPPDFAQLSAASLAIAAPYFELSSLAQVHHFIGIPVGIQAASLPTVPYGVNLVTENVEVEVVVLPTPGINPWSNISLGADIWTPIVH